MDKNIERIKNDARECLIENGYEPISVSCGYVPDDGFKLWATGLKDNIEYRFVMHLSNSQLKCLNHEDIPPLDMTKWKNRPFEVVAPREKTLEEKINSKASILGYNIGEYSLAKEELDKTQRELLELKNEYGGNYDDIPVRDRESIELLLYASKYSIDGILSDIEKSFDELCDLAKGEKIPKLVSFYLLEELLSPERLKKLEEIEWR